MWVLTHPNTHIKRPKEIEKEEGGGRGGKGQKKCYYIYRNQIFYTTPGVQSIGSQGISRV